MLQRGRDGLLGVVGRDRRVLAHPHAEEVERDEAERQRREAAPATRPDARRHRSANASPASPSHSDAAASGTTSFAVSCAGSANAHAVASPSPIAPRLTSDAHQRHEHGHDEQHRRSAEQQPRLPDAGEQIVQPPPGEQREHSSVDDRQPRVVRLANPGTRWSDEEERLHADDDRQRDGAAAAIATRSRVGRSSATTASISGSAPA